MDARLEDSLAAALGSRVLEARPLAGGDINQAFEVGLADGRAVFVKCNVSAPNDMFVAEARGLAWLGEAKFRKGVQRYLKTHAHGNGTAKDFLAALSAEGHESLVSAYVLPQRPVNPIQTRPQSE